MEQDKLYSQERKDIEQFVFDKEVAGCFDDMIKRSVPGYAAIINMIGCLAKEYVKSNTQCYDLGCSLGASSLAMINNIDHDDCHIIAVDNAPAMVERCQEVLSSAKGKTSTQVKCADIRDVKVENASMVVLNFTLQFIEPENRQKVLQNISDGINPGGILIISEKIKFTDQTEEEFQTQLHHTFKKLNGYSDLEISQKRTALENVLVPDTLEEHHKRLAQVGFDKSYTWFQCFNFVSIFACK